MPATVILALNAGAWRVILAAHHPIFMPWPGFFHKAVYSDCIVLLDGVQYPRGRTWLNRNRLKNDAGELWLTVPVLKKGRGLQVIRNVEIHNGRKWRQKHLRSIQQNYVHAPYYSRYFSSIEAVYAKGHSLLAELNEDLISIFLDAFSIEARVLRQSELGAAGAGTHLLVDVCKRAGADRFITFPMVEKHIDRDTMRANGIEVMSAHFHPPVYPQLWGDFIYNLSALDLLLNCGPKGAEIMDGSTGRGRSQ
jgi:hypothetical protein